MTRCRTSFYLIVVVIFFFLYRCKNYIIVGSNNKIFFLYDNRKYEVISPTHLIHISNRVIIIFFSSIIILINRDILCRLKSITEKHLLEQYMKNLHNNKKKIKVDTRAP